jgi:hypothetical protein
VLLKKVAADRNGKIQILSSEELLQPHAGTFLYPGTLEADVTHRWYLQEYSLDLINWTMRNSHRKDIKLVPENFREQTIEEVLPPDELPVRRHNANRFVLDGGNDGRSENSAGDIWLLPYWLRRYLKIIY